MAAYAVFLNQHGAISLSAECPASPPLRQPCLPHLPPPPLPCLLQFPRWSSIPIQDGGSWDSTSLSSTLLRRKPISSNVMCKGAASGIFMSQGPGQFSETFVSRWKPSIPRIDFYRYHELWKAVKRGSFSLIWRVFFVKVENSKPQGDFT